MSMEEQDLLRSAVREFAQKSMEDRVLKIEHDGIDETLLKQLAGQGFLAARFPEKYGGSGIDRSGYLAILQELATVSPSVAAAVMATNSIIAPLLGDSEPEIMGKLAAGELKIALSLGQVLEGNNHDSTVTAEGKSVSGKVPNTAFSDGSMAIVLSGGNNHLYLLKGGITQAERDQGLSFRGLNYGTIDVSTGDYSTLSEDGAATLGKVMDGMDLEVAALALGMSKGALDKAIEYVKVRKTFDRPLKDYGPVASSLSGLMAEYEVLNHYLASGEHEDERDGLMIKKLAVDLAKRATKYSLQFHGGYGYIEDFGVEKFYRDSMGLAILFQRPHADSQRLSKEVFGEKSGYL